MLLLVFSTPALPIVYKIEEDFVEKVKTSVNSTGVDRIEFTLGE